MSASVGLPKRTPGVSEVIRETSHIWNGGRETTHSHRRQWTTTVFPSAFSSLEGGARSLLQTDSTSAMVGSSPSPFLSSPFKRQTSSIRSLRKELASEGCADSQLILAKDYLAEAEAHDARKEGGESEAPPSAVSSTDDSKNHLAASAVYWLTKAADNGSEEAVELLSDCFSKRKGIDAQNYATVKACLQRTPQEQLARKAGRMVFQSLCDGNDFITSNQLARRLYKCEASPVLGASMPNEPARTSAESSALDDLELLYGGEKLSEQDVVNCSLSYERGLCPSVPSPTAFPVVPPAPSRLLFPRWFPSLILSHPLFRFSPSSQSSFTPFYFSAFLFLLFLFSFLFLSQPIFLASSVVAVVVTVSLLRSSRTLQTFRAWSSLLSSMEPRLDTVTLERKFLSSHRTTRFLLFLFSLALCILSRPPPKSLPWFLPAPECALLSLLLALAVLFSFPSHLEASLCVSFLVLLVLCQFSFFRSSFLLPLNSFLDSLDPLLSSSLVQSLQWDFALEIFLFSVPSLLLFSPSWGLPPLIFVFWISFASYFTSSAKFLPWSSWLRAFLIVSSPFFLRFVPLFLKAFLYLAVLPILAASVTSFLSSPSWEILYWFSLPFVLTMLVLTGILRRKLFPPQSCPPSASKPTCTYLRRVWISLLYFSVLLCFTPFLPFPSHNTSYRLLLLPRGPFADPSFVPIPWEKFYNACRVPRDHASSMTTLQRKNTCSRLHGQNVEGWEGTIVDIADSGPSQDWRGINMFLAKWIPTFVQCAFATEKQSYEDADFCVPPWVLSEESEIVFMVSMPKPSGDTEWGWIGSGEEKLTRIEVRATSFCAKDFSLALLRGDRVSISGVLDLRRDSDTSLPVGRIILRQLTCVDCKVFKAHVRFDCGSWSVLWNHFMSFFMDPWKSALSLKDQKRKHIP